MTDNRFSTREQDVIACLLQGKSNKAIALHLGITNRTVEAHLSNIYAKLNVTSRTEAVLQLSNHHLWKSTGDLETTHQGIPQLKEVSDRVIVRKIYYPPSRLRRHPMKTVVHMIILLLVFLLMVALIFGAFALLRQNLTSSVFLGFFFI